MENRKPWRTRVGWNVALVIAGLILGFFFAAQWNVAPEAIPSTLTQSREDLTTTIRRLEQEQEALKNTISLLRGELAQRQEAMAHNTELLEDLARDLEAQKMAAGLHALKGPGMRITLADSDVDTLPPNADPNLYVIHEYDLRDAVNLLWAADAEAIAINDERIVSITSIYCVGSTIMVNDARLSPPYQITTIGDITKLERSLNNPASLKGLKSRAKVYGLQFRVTKENEVIVPAYRGSFSIRYAKPGS